MSSRLRFVDPHVHLWELKTGWYPLLDPQTDTSGQDHGVGPFGKLQGSDFLLPDYFAHASDYDVAKIVHVTAAQAPPTWPDETRYLEELAEKEGYPHGIIGWTDFDRPLASSPDFAESVTRPSSTTPASTSLRASVSWNNGA
jgi:predicted TIM-barrel fold metal-dependent hydrolase